MKLLRPASVVLFCAVQASALQSTAPYSDADIVVLARQAIVGDARQQGLSADALGRSVNVRPDLDVAKDVRSVLQDALEEKLSALSVSCIEGTVTLRGRVDSAADAEHALLLASAVPGARSVRNLLVAPDQPAVAPGASEPVARAAGPAQCEPFSFLTHDSLGGRDLVLSVQRGEVQIHGLASTSQARDYATEAVRRVPGARLVKNQMVVRSAPAGEDDRLGKLIAHRLEWSADLRPVASSFSVIVRDGIVTLRGQVRSPAQRALALELASSCDGVVVVEDRIRGPGGP